VVGGATYYPYPINVGIQTRDSSGTLPEVEVTVSNVDAQIAGRLEAGDIIDRRCRIRAVYSTDLGNPFMAANYEVLGATLNLSVATFRLGVFGLLDTVFPAVRFFRGRCPYVYGGPECAYDTSLPNLSGAPGFDRTTCDHTFEGANGCRAHGANEVACGVPELHPLRYGGYPSIPRGPARV
jgi:phage-related protein